MRISVEWKLSAIDEKKCRVHVFERTALDPRLACKDLGL